MKLYVDKRFKDLHEYLFIKYKGKLVSEEVGNKFVLTMNDYKDILKDANGFIQRTYLVDASAYLANGAFGAVDKRVNKIYYDALKNLYEKYQIKLLLNSGYRPLLSLVYGQTDFKDIEDRLGHWIGMSLDLRTKATADLFKMSEQKFVETLKLYGISRPFLGNPYFEKWHYRQGV